MHSSYSLILLQFAACVLLSSFLCEGWVTQSLQGPQISRTTRSVSKIAHISELQSPSQCSRLKVILASSAEGLSVAEEEDDDDDEYEYVEYEILREPDFMGSEWLVGTVMENNDDITETWVRLVTDKDGKNVAVWGDNSQGTWNLDVANQFLSVSKNSLIGKNIWAGVVDDFYYCRGTVRGWNFFSPASVVGQWQAKRLGVEKGEAGIAPWFEEPEEEETMSALSEADQADLDSTTNMDIA